MVAATHMGDIWELVPPIIKEGEVVPILRLVVELPVVLQSLLQLLKLCTFLLGKRWFVLWGLRHIRGGSTREVGRGAAAAAAAARHHGHASW